MPDASWPVGTLMSRLTAAERTTILSLGAVRGARTGTVLMRLGEPGTLALLLRKGLVKVTVPSNGRETLLDIRVAGDVVGEMSVLNDVPRSATVIAAGDTVFTVISRARLRSFLDAHANAAIQLAGVVAGRLRWANRRRIDVAAYPVHVRLARLLAEMAVAYGRRTPEGIEITPDITQPELASLIGVAEVTVNRALGRLREKRLVGTGYRRHVVTDLPGLRELGGLETD